MAKGIGKIVIAILVIAVLCYTAAFGMTIGTFKMYPVFDDENGIRKGFDLAGGSVIVYQATQTAEDGTQIAIEPTEEQMGIAKKIIESRLDRKGYTEGTVTTKGNQLEVELPSVQDTAQAIQEIGQTAKLAFFGFDMTTGQLLSDAIISGDDIISAKSEYQQLSATSAPEYIVKIQITDDAVQRFADATTQFTGKSIAIMLDEDLISAPMVNERIENKEFFIQGDFTKEASTELAALINDGQLPFNLSVVQQRTAGPTLGDSALQTSLLAALIGLIIIFVFMIALYRLPGFVASIALVFYVALCCLIYAGLRINLSLPGIAGVILSIGMAVDANVIIFERMKEEFKLGKTLKASLDAGFNRALISIIDSNVTTIIAAGVLYFLGSGPIKGFAITLGVGILVSMFTAIIVTKFLLKALVDLNIKNKFLYGAPLKGGNNNA